MRLVSLCLFVTASAGGAAEPWSGYGGPGGSFRVPAPGARGGPAWKRELGPGTAGVVSDGTRLFTVYAVTRGPRACDEVTVALDPATGKALWEERVRVEAREKQETFGGAPVQPQATPAVSDGRVFALGFAGALAARDAATGKLLWSVDLVADSGATPVQYGFAASPVVFDGKLIVHVGGKHAVVAFDPKTGKRLWASAAGEPGYATPVLTKWDGRAVVVQLARDALFAFDATTGETAWRYDLPKKGLTNVPTPIALSDGRLIVSGQGLEGTRLLSPERRDGAVTVREVWHQRKVQFFYTNWACDGDTVYGFAPNAGKRLTALAVKDGAIRFQDLGYTDATVVLLGPGLLVLRGDGVLASGPVTAEGFEPAARGKAVTGRCWVPPTVIGGTAYVRSAGELAAVPLSALTADFKPPADAGRTALDEAFAPKPKPKEKPNAPDR